MIGDTFICAGCGKTFQKVKTDKEADIEAKKLFDVDNASESEDFAVICSDCFKEYMKMISN